MYHYVDLKLGYECNNNCIHCVIAHQRQKAVNVRNNANRSTEECKKEILNIFNKGCLSLVITGGEPTIRTDFTEIVSFAKDLNMFISLQTNGRKFSDSVFTSEVVKYIDFFVIALHGSNPDIHDYITSSKGSFLETCKGIKNIRKHSKNICGKIVISNHNYKDLINILDILNRLSVKKMNIAFPHPNGNAAKYFSQVVPYYKNIKQYLEECIDYSKKNNLDLDFEAILPCILDAKYDLKYYSDFKNINIESEVKQLDSKTLEWHKIRKKMKKKDEKCKRCIYNTYCEGYWIEYVEMRGFSEFKPITGDM